MYTPIIPDLITKARDCYHRLCPHAAPDLPPHKSSTMSAYIEGATVYNNMLDQERDTWHTLHNRLNQELSQYKKFLNDLLVKDCDNVNQICYDIIKFLGHKDRL